MFDPQRPEPVRTSLPAIVLAGGRARAMDGADKALLQMGGRRLIARALERISPQCGTVAIAAGGDPGRFAAYGRPVLADPFPDHPGPLAGILAGMDWAASLGAASVASVAVDSPFFPHDLAARLSEAAGRRGVAIAATPDGAGGVRRHPVFGVWPVALRDRLRDALMMGECAVGYWAELQGARAVRFSAGPPDPFFNINAPADLRRAETLAASVR